jgi:hypothetical protein
MRALTGDANSFYIDRVAESNGANTWRPGRRTPFHSRARREQAFAHERGSAPTVHARGR